MPFICSLPIENHLLWINSKLTVLRLQGILARAKYSFLYVSLLILYKLMKLVYEQGQFSMFIVNYFFFYCWCIHCCWCKMALVETPGLPLHIQGRAWYLIQPL